MDRGELDSLDRDALIARAEALRVPRARILTRAELVDEILVALGQTNEVADGASDADLPAMRAARGFFGRARDLLARVVERGLHLPDAAERIRRLTPPPPPRRPEPPMPTVTLAEIYAAQGHGQRAMDTLRSVLAQEPDHSAARALLTRLQAEPPRTPALPRERDDEEPSAPFASHGPTMVPPTLHTGSAALAPSAPRVEDTLGDACVCLPHGDDGIFVFWNAATSADGLVLRFVVLRPTWDGPHVEVRDLPVDAARGEAILRDIPARATVRVALGVGEGRLFAPLTHSAALSLADGVVQRWTLEGTKAVVEGDPDATAIGCAIARRGAGP